MSASSTAAFRVECPECDVEEESDEFDEVSSFVGKHHKHTGHDMEWVHAEFDYTVDTTTDWKISCDHCSDEWEFGTIEQVEDFKKEHAEYTDHEITGEPTEVVIDDLDDVPVKEIIRKLEDRYEEGAPEQAVYAILTKNDIEIANIKTEIEQLRQKGEVYEPTQGHLRTT